MIFTRKSLIISIMVIIQRNQYAIADLGPVAVSKIQMHPVAQIFVVMPPQQVILGIVSGIIEPIDAVAAVTQRRRTVNRGPHIAVAEISHIGYSQLIDIEPAAFHVQIGISDPQLIKPDTVAGIDIFDRKISDRLVILGAAGADDQHPVSIVTLFDIVERDMIAADYELIAGNYFFDIHIVVHVFSDQDNDIAIDLAEP